MAPSFSSPAVVYSCTHPVPQAAQRIKARLRDMGIPLFAEFDHQTNAYSAGLTLTPTRVLVFGAPEVGTLLMQANGAVALELPLRIAVWEDDAGKTWLAHPDMTKLAEEYGLNHEPTREVLTKMQGLLEKLSTECAAERRR